MQDALDKLDMPEDLRAALREALARLVELAKPEVVILFGSWAEGRARPDSDVDLVVVARTNNRSQLEVRLYALWWQIQDKNSGLTPADILVFTPREFESEQVPGFAAYQAARHGTILYGRLPEQRKRLAS